jgi:Cof subfamily protein (haloacid dehalogenase superfamily)
VRSRTDPHIANGLLAAVSDLDGTLMGSGELLSLTTLGVLTELRRRGVPMIVATGRTPRTIRRIAEHEQLGTMICADGALVWDPDTDAVLEQTSFDLGGLRAAAQHLRAAVPEVSVSLLSADTVFRDDRNPTVRPVRAGVVRISNYSEDLAGQEIVFVQIRHETLRPADLVGPVAAAFDGVGSIALEGRVGIDVVPTGITKAVTAHKMLERVGYLPETTVVFGDMPNDLPLFGWAGWSCAVSNAHHSVLAAADEIVPSNEEDGVATTLRRLFET